MLSVIRRPHVLNSLGEDVKVVLSWERCETVENFDPGLIRHKTKPVPPPDRDDEPETPILQLECRVVGFAGIDVLWDSVQRGGPDRILMRIHSTLHSLP